MSKFTIKIGEYCMDKFNFKHLFFIVSSVTIAALKTYPEIFMRIAGRDSWICVIVASLIITICFYCIIRIYVNNKYENLKDIFTVALGNFSGKLFLTLFAFALFLTLIESAATETSVIHFNLFIESPNWFILFFIILPGLYTVTKGKNAVMAVLMICIIISISNGINLYILTFPNKKYKWIFPIFERGIDLKFFIGIIKILGMYASIAISLPYLYLIDKSKKLTRCALVSSLFVCQMILVAIVGLLATFSVERVNVIIFPKIIQTQLITYFGFIASGEFYVIFQVISGWFSKYIATMFALLITLKELNIDKFCNVKFLPYSISGLVYIMSYVLSSNLINLFEFLNYYNYISLSIFLIMPLLVFTIYGIRCRISSKSN
jgi:spore germination protein (amino acid permease)